MRLGLSTSFRFLTSPLLFRLQDVSLPCSVSFFLCPDKFFALPSSERECPSFSRIFFFFDESLILPSPGRECPSLSQTLVLITSFLHRLKAVSAFCSVAVFFLHVLPRHSSVCECSVVHFFRSADLSFFSVLAESGGFFFSIFYFRSFDFIFQLIFDHLTSFYRNVLSLCFGFIMILLIDV